MKKFLIIFFLLLLTEYLYAARSHTIVNLNGYPVNFYMRDSVTMNLRVTNTNTGGDVDLSINRVRITFPNNTLTVNATGHIPPTGWTVTVNSATQITFDSTNAIYNITTNNFRDFLVSLTVVAGATDSALESITSSVARYTNNRTSTVNNPSTVSWYRRGLKITSMIASPDLLNSGEPFTLTITVQNVSTAVQNNITANPNPPTETSTGGFNPDTNSNPSITSLAVLATANLVYNYTTKSNDEGTVYFTCNVRNGLNNTTGISTSSNIVYIGRFTTNITFSPECPLSGETINVTLTVTNYNTFTLSNVTPTLNTGGSATLVRLSGPTPPTVATLNSGGGTASFTYTYQITGNYNDSFTFTGYAVGQKTTPPTGTRQSTSYTTPTRYVRGYSIDVVPDIILSDSKYVMLKFTLFNKANSVCPIDTSYYLKKVLINIPSGFSYEPGSASYLIGNNVTDVNSQDFEYYTNYWNITENLSSIEFSSSSSTYNLITNKNAYFTLLLNKVPSVLNDTNYYFVTDVQNANNLTRTFNDNSVKLTVTPVSTGSTKKPVPVKGSYREKQD